MNTSVQDKAIRPNAGRERKRSVNYGNALEIDSLLWRLNARANDKKETGQVIAVTSCCRDSGVSTLVANLAVRAADNHMGPILIIDANVASPKQHRLFRHKTKIGLADVLVGTLAPAEAVIPTNTEALDLLPLGLPSNLAGGQVISEHAEELIRWASENYSMTLIDLPKIDEMRHELVLARRADFALVAVRYDSVRRLSATQSVERLISDGVTVLGTVLTRKTIWTPSFLRSN